MARTVTVEINQQQAELLDRLLAEGGFGSSYADAIRQGFLEFCKEHPELTGAKAGARADA